MPSVLPARYSAGSTSPRNSAVLGNASANGDQCRIHLVAAELGIQRRERALPNIGMLLAVAVDHDVQNLVDQPHRVNLGRRDGQLRMASRVALLVHALGEHARGMKIGEHHAAARRKQVVVKAVALTDAARNMKLHRSRPFG